MSKRTKFVLITWIGPRVGVMDRAKVTSDKSLVKQIITVDTYVIRLVLLRWNGVNVPITCNILFLDGL